MKIRIGFVSNSSSSSFCIYKKLMTAKQIEEFRDLLHNRSNGDYCETSIGEDGDYFIGSLDMHDDLVCDFIRRNFKRNEYADYC
jgi:hypothetical protein